MKYTYLGETGLEVSQLCLGCMNFGSDEPWMMNDREASLKVIDRAIEQGINFLDTANVYSAGESEEIVGEAIAGRRDDLVVATKVHGQMADRPNGGGLSRKHILEQAYESLDRLDTDYIDLYQIHRWDEDTPIEETLAALDHLVDEGVVRYVGASTMAAWQFTKALYTSDLEGYERFVSMQPQYSLVRRHEELNLLPVCTDQGVGVVPWSPLASGFLTGKYTRDQAPEGSRLAEAKEAPGGLFDEDEWATLDAVREIAEDHDATPTQVSLAWLLHKDVVTAPIIGPKSVDQLEEALPAVDVDLSAVEVERLEEHIDPVYAPS